MSGMEGAARRAQVERETGETQVRLVLEIDGDGTHHIATGIGFLDHMLVLLARHSLWNLEIQAQGDLHVDDHHTTEDVGIALGQAVREALGNKAGICRYGHCTLPMDETLVTAAVDLSGRAAVVYRAPIASPKIGSFDSELVEHFWTSFAHQAACNLHVLLHHGSNSHHIAEAVFKGLARALRMACQIDPRQSGIPSSKGRLVD